MRLTLHRRLAVLAVLLAAAALALLVAAAGADAQCAMCKTAVRAGGEQTARTMRSAMLVLLVPSVAIFCSLFAVFVKYGRSRAGGGQREGDDGDG